MIDRAFTYDIDRFFRAHNGIAAMSALLIATKRDHEYMEKHGDDRDSPAWKRANARLERAAEFHDAMERVAESECDAIAAEQERYRAINMEIYGSESAPLDPNERHRLEDEYYGR